jgi:hypothetical protein
VVQSRLLRNNHTLLENLMDEELYDETNVPLGKSNLLIGFNPILGLIS